MENAIQFMMNDNYFGLSIIFLSIYCISLFLLFSTRKVIKYSKDGNTRYENDKSRGNWTIFSGPGFSWTRTRIYTFPKFIRIFANIIILLFSIIYIILFINLQLHYSFPIIVFILSALILLIFCINYIYCFIKYYYENKSYRNNVKNLKIKIKEAESQFKYFSQNNLIPNEIISIRAEKLREDYLNKNIQADNIYKGKYLRISGNLETIYNGTMYYFNPRVIFDKDFSINFNKIILCLKKSEKNNFIKRTTNSRYITITGICEGKILSDIYISNVIISKN